MEPILISACLLGAACRYDGGSNPVLSVEALMGRCQLVPVCPEQLGGLPTPREPAERTEGGVVTKTGADVSTQFQRGAEQALHLARIFGCKKAVLKERSPSCGAGEIYDGSFTGARVPGDGVTAQLLKANGIVVFGESEIETLLEQLDEAQEEAPSFEPSPGSEYVRSVPGWNAPLFCAGLQNRSFHFSRHAV